MKPGTLTTTTPDPRGYRYFPPDDRNGNRKNYVLCYGEPAMVIAFVWSPKYGKYLDIAQASVPLVVTAHHVCWTLNDMLVAVDE